jgi:glycosyltransferase involved in cell wall biosynthesis
MVASSGSAARPRILFVTPVVPAFTGLGAAMRCAFSVASLCDLAEVTLLLVRRPANREEPIAEGLRNRLAEVVEITLPEGLETPRERFAGLAGVAGLVRRALHPAPLELGDYPAIAADDIALSGGSPWHSMHVFRLRIAPLALRVADRLGIPAKRRVLDLDDVESVALRRLAEARRAELGGATYWLERLESIKTARAEERLARSFGTVLLCSTRDQQAFQRRCPQCAVGVLPNVYPLPATTGDEPRLPPSSPTVLFVGSLDYPPNQDAVRLLLQEIVPLVRNTTPDVVFRVAGRRPPEWMARDCAARKVELVANPPDMAPLYRDATVTVVPLLSGGGTRIKILEAFAYGVPVVSTTVGAEGLVVTHGHDILIADTVPGFAQHIDALVGDSAFRQKLAAAGRETLCRSYGPVAMQRQLMVAHALSGIGVA